MVAGVCSSTPHLSTLVRNNLLAICLTFLCNVRRVELWFFSLSCFPVISKKQIVRTAWICSVKLWHGCVLAVGLGNIKLTQWRPAVLKGDSAFSLHQGLLRLLQILGKDRGIFLTLRRWNAGWAYRAAVTLFSTTGEKLSSVTHPKKYWHCGHQDPSLAPCS